MSAEDRRCRLRSLREQLVDTAEEVMVELLPTDNTNSVAVVDTYLEATLSVCDYLTKARQRIDKAASKVGKLLAADDE